MEIELKVKRIGQKRLIFYFPKKFRNECEFNSGDTIKLEIEKKNKKETSISKFNYNISLKKQIISSLSLKEGDLIKIKMQEVRPPQCPSDMFQNGKIDLLFFIPKITRKGSKVFVEEMFKNSESYLRLCSFHQRGSGSQIEIRRFINPELFGRFLGQIQAEGTKFLLDKLEFCNKSFEEHKEFLNFLYHLGISKKTIFSKLDYHINIKNIKKEIDNFEKITGLKLNYSVPTSKSRGGFGFKIIVRNTLLSELILGIMDSLRNILANKEWGILLEEFAKGFFAKILDGDGSFEIITKNRNIPQARLTIYDGNINYLEDYKIIMERFGFKPKINQKWKFVRSYCSPKLAKMILSIGAFMNNPNKIKLERFINSRFSNKADSSDILKN